MDKFTENEKYRIILCVKYARHDLSIKLLKAEIEYESHKHYDAELEQSIEQTDESIAFYDALISKLEKIL